MGSKDILAPDLPESVSNATIVAWRKNVGDNVCRNDVLVEIETDKIILEVVAPEDGKLISLLKEAGSAVVSRQVLGKIQINSVKNDDCGLNDDNCDNLESKQKRSLIVNDDILLINDLKNKYANFSPSFRRLVAENDCDLSIVLKKCNDNKYNVLYHEFNKMFLNKKDKKDNIEAFGEKNSKINILKYKNSINSDCGNDVKRVPMSRIRKRIAERLLSAKNNTAMLTTFNEVNMKPIIDLRDKYGERFELSHGIRLGYMSFFVKSVVKGLQLFPEVNSFIDGDDIVYYKYYDISVAVSTSRGLVTPVIKSVDNLNMADVEKKIKDLALKGRDNKLTIDDLTGGNFTITNGGIFGSLMSTPIINPPQCAILAMHVIKDRPVVVDKKIIILPMMYLSLSYDHRIIDGKEAVGFLVVIKEMLEDPIRLLLDV